MTPPTNEMITWTPAARSRRSALAFLGRWWWLILLGALIGALLASLLARSSAPIYTAESLITAQTPIDADGFGPLAEEAFAQHIVLDPVVDELGLEVQWQELVQRGQLQAHAVAGSPGLRVVGRASDPRLAAELSTEAAQSFATQAAKKGLGVFAIYPSGPEGTRQQPPLRSGAIAGALGGALAAAAALLLLFSAWQPVLSREEAQHHFPSDAAFSARMKRRLRLNPFSRSRSADGRIRPRGVVKAINRALDNTGAFDPTSLCCVLVGDGSSRALLQEIAHNQVTNGRAGAPERTWSLVQSTEDGRLLDALNNAKVVVAFVAEGVGRTRLQALDEELRSAPGEKYRILVFVSKARP